jgi:hypothetical protein
MIFLYYNPSKNDDTKESTPPLVPTPALPAIVAVIPTH